MRQTAGTLNRTWLAILGVVVLTAGTALLLQASGTAAFSAGHRTLKGLRRLR